MWRDLASFKSLSDKKPSQPVSDTFADAFMNVSQKSTQKNYKKRCSMDEVCIPVLRSHTREYGFLYAHNIINLGFGNMGYCNSNNVTVMNFSEHV